MNIMEVFDYTGVALFAATGALAASRKQLDIVGFMFLAAMTGIGGGTLRDLTLGVGIFWIEQPAYVIVCALTAILFYFTAHLAESRYRWLLWLDAAALSAYGVFGAYKGLAITGSPTIAIVMGMMTGTLGGIFRDVLTNEPSVLLRQEIYVSAAIAGASVFVVAASLGGGLVVSSALGFATTFCLRGGALTFNWSLPTYRSRKGRDPDDS